MIDKEAAVDRNLALAFDLLQAQFSDPALLREIPNGATVIFIPEDDPELAEYNFGLARVAVARGQNVYLKRVRTPPPVAP